MTTLEIHKKTTVRADKISQYRDDYDTVNLTAA